MKSLLAVALCVVLLWDSRWLAKPSVNADSDATNGIILTMDADSPIVDTGKAFTYEIKFSFSSLAVNGINFNALELNLPLPAGVQYLGYVSIPVITGVTRGGPGTVVDGTLTGETLKFAFNTTTPPAEGDSYTLQVNARYVPYVTLDGTTTTTAATMTQGGVERDRSADVTVEANASSAWALAKSMVSPRVTPMVGGNVQYEILFNNTNSTSEIGQLDIENVTLTDDLPDDSIFVSASGGGTYDAGTHTVRWTPSGTMRHDTRYYVTVNYPSPTFDLVPSVTNTAIVTYTELGKPAVLTRTDNVTHGFQVTPQDNGLGGIFYKNRNTHQREISKGQDVTFTIGGFHNYANVPLTDGSIVDLTPTVDTGGTPVDFDVKSVQTATFRDAPSVTYSVYYATNALADDWTLWKDVDSEVSESLDASLISPAPSKITGLKFSFGGALPISFTQTSDFAITYTLDSAYSVNVAGQQVINTATAYYTYEGSTKHFDDTADVYLWGNRPLVELTKTKLGGSSFSPEQEITFQIRVRNTELSSDLFNNPIVMDELPESLDYVANSASIVDSSPGLLSVGALADPSNTSLPGDKRLLRWTFSPLSMATNQYFTIQYKAKVKKFATPGTYINYAEVTSNANPYFNDYWFDLKTDTADHDGDGSMTDKLIRDEEQFTVNQVAALGSFKRVRGELDGDWTIGQRPAGWQTGDPDPLGRTVSGGRVDYKLTVYNKGNVPLDNIVLVDVLPKIGDEGALLGARGTTWNTVLTDALPAGTDYVVWYSTDDHPKMTGGAWDTVPPADLTTVTGLKFVFTPSYVLAPDQKINIVWTMKAPVGTPVDQIAWNSFGQQASIAGGGSALAPAEPPKVGIHIKADPKVALGNYVWIDLNKNGIQDEDLSKWGVNGVRVELRYTDGTQYYKTYADDGVVDNVPIFTVTGDDQNGNPGYYSFPNLNPGNYRVRFTLPNALPMDYEYSYGTNVANRITAWTLKETGGDSVARLERRRYVRRA